ncbi:hypothetical protein PTKIN_Ptkin01aG0261300 [Pterospermum kingtungense]
MDNFSFSNISFPSHQLPYLRSSHGQCIIAISTLVSFDHSKPVLLLLLAILFLVKFKGHARYGNPNRPPLPPGPIPWPIIGNLPEIWNNKPAFRPITMATVYASRGFLSTALVPWGDQWKKMRKVVASNVISPARLSRLLHKRTQEADNLVRFIYNQCINSTENDIFNASVINVRLVARQYSGNVIRKMMFNKRYFGKGKEDGGPGHEEEEHVDSLFTVLLHLYSFVLSDYVSWLRALDLEGHEKIVSEATKIINGYHDPIIDERVQQWRSQGKKKEAEDLLDALILAKDSNGKPALSIEEIKGQCMVRFLRILFN